MVFPTARTTFVTHSSELGTALELLSGGLRAPFGVHSGSALEQFWDGGYFAMQIGRALEQVGTAVRRLSGDRTWK